MEIDARETQPEETRSEAGETQAEEIATRLLEPTKATALPPGFAGGP
jgi:hypothetical protein